MALRSAALDDDPKPSQLGQRRAVAGARGSRSAGAASSENLHTGQLPNFDHACIAASSTFQVAASAVLRITAQVLLIVPVIGYVVLFSRVALLGMARGVEAFNVPGATWAAAPKIGVLST